MNDNDQDLDDKALFMQAMGKVKPLAQDKIVTADKRSKQKITLARKKQTLEQHKQQFYFSDQFEPNLETSGPVKYVRDDVDSFEVKRLRRGEYYPDITLDLHGLNQQQSKQEIAALLGECKKQHVNCACIIHGIGNRILKNKVPHWLVQHPDIMAFHQAPLEFGGDGALLVLIDLQDDFMCK
ncbi:endonuclease SmrB [Thalassotalea ponticola]|uniref:endonuclease SmrB n=1 Tax=Thalassotalea ponticola TaxID=1523392 RepID=UPI0025B6009E|nr:endonuclease SmrB [Thalassotalea ponticola]MDN3651638.1 endonuclease SmrB [Thalassotalea ponticola]